MLDLGWSETFFILVLGLVVIGPRDLPRLARAVGRVVGQVRRIYRDALGGLTQLEREVSFDEDVTSGRYDSDLGTLRLTPEALAERRATRHDPHGGRSERREASAGRKEQDATTVEGGERQP